MKETKHSTAAAGMLGWSRGSSSQPLAFFGSRVKSREIITITLMSAGGTRMLAGDWFHGDKIMFEVDMTPVQWAEFITTPNTGSGVPCTLNLARDGNLQKHERPELETEAEAMSAEYKDSLEELRGVLHTMEQTAEALDKGRGVLTIGARKRITDNIWKAYNILTDSLPFLAERFAKNMDATVVECKLSIDAYVSRVIHETGLKHLQSDIEKSVPQIPHKESDDEST